MDLQQDSINTLTQLISELLIARQWMLGAAESCTGGMLCENITNIAGSSAWFSCGFITYSNDSKTQMLDVEHETLDAHGAVSEAVAAEMACGVLANSEANISVSITGIAGPSGGTELKPVGMVCFAWAIHEQAPTTTTQYFNGTRNEVRAQATAFALSGLIAHLRKQAN